MTISNRPNTFIQVDGSAKTILSYTAQTNPSPLTVSASETSGAVVGSMQVFISNATASDQTISSITINVVFGSGAALMQSADAETDYPTDWELTTPPPDGSTQNYKLTGPLGATFILAKGDWAAFELYDFDTVLVPTPTTVTITEVIGSSTAQVPITITTFPQGFFFGGLVANATPPGGGSVYTPVAQVSNSDTVTLTWNSSVLDTSGLAILYSDAFNGQQSGTPTAADTWTSQPLTSDTVFTVSVTADLADGGTAVVTESVTVSVLKPDLIANSVVIGVMPPGGPSGLPLAGDLFIQGNVYGGPNYSATVAPEVLNVEELSVWSALKAQNANVELFSVISPLLQGTYMNETDGLLVGYASMPENIIANVPPIVCGAEFNNSFTLPVPAHAGFQALGATGSFFWVPLGIANTPTSPSANTLTRIGDAQKTQAVKFAPRPKPEEPLLDFIGALEEILEKPIAGEKREKLLAAMRKI